MEHVGMILFLSDVKVTAEGNIRVTSYKEPIGDCYTTNESAVRYVQTHTAQPLERLFVFATNKVRSNITYKNKDGMLKPFQDEAGQTYTHLSYFAARLKAMTLPLDVASYDENASVQENMHSIVDMAAKVDAYIASLPDGDTLVIHADCTGGMRHAAMVMMAVLRLMQYDERIRIGDILYSNYQKQIVEKANDIYALFDLIAGAEEFVRFGSVQTMLDYYARQDTQHQSVELQQLLQAMTSFADAISLCHYGTFRKAIEELRIAMKKFHDRFRSGEGMQLADAFINRLYGRIRHEYKQLLQEENPDDLTLIDWCVRHDYIQQALTLYTERIPELFNDCNLAALTKSGKIVFKKQFEKDKTTSFAFQLYTLFRDKEKEESAQKEMDSQRSAYCRFLKQEIIAVSQKAKEDTTTDWAHVAVAHIQEYLQQLSVESTVVLDNPDRLYQGFALIQALCRTPGKVILDELDMQLMAKCRQLQQFYRAHNNMETFLSKKPYAQGKALCNWSPQMKVQELLDFFSDFSIPYSERFIRLLRREWVVSNVPEAKLRLLLDRYGALKDERNHTNHARQEQQTLTVQDIRQLLQQGLSEINDICHTLPADGFSDVPADGLAKES